MMWFVFSIFVILTVVFAIIADTENKKVGSIGVVLCVPFSILSFLYLRARAPSFCTKQTQKTSCDLCNIPC